MRYLVKEKLEYRIKMLVSDQRRSGWWFQLGILCAPDCDRIFLHAKPGTRSLERVSLIQSISLRIVL